jgi:hypothetical protein
MNRHNIKSKTVIIIIIIIIIALLLVESVRREKLYKLQASSLP